MKISNRNVKFFSAVLLLLLIFSLPSLLYPFGRDQGIHAQVGAAWLEGEFPYRDVWHPKGFLSFVPHALATAVFGREMVGIRVVDMVWQFGSGLLIFLIGRRRMGQRGALLAAGLYYLVYYAFGYWHTAQPEGFLTPVVLLAVWLYDKAGEGKRPSLFLFLSGFTVAMAPWFKQTAVVFIAALLAWFIYDWRQNRRQLSEAAPLVGGIAATNLLVLFFTAATGMLAPMLEAFSYAFFEYPKVDQASWLEMASLSGAWGVWYPALIFPFLAGLGYIFFNRRLRPGWLGIILMAFAGLAGIYIQRRLWIYHWVSTLPFMILIGAFSIQASLAFLQALDDRKRKSVVWLLGFACLSLVWPILSRHLAYTVDAVSLLNGRTTRTEYLEEHELLEVVETAEYLAEHTGANEPIFVWGHYAMIYYLADRPNPTRFSNDPPLSLPHGRLEKWRQEVAEDLSADPPAYIVVATDDTTGFEQLTSEEQLAAFDALDILIAERYLFETMIGGFELYVAVQE